MYNNLLTIYKDKIIENPNEFNIDKYYYFYGPKGNIFGIEKTISLNEYKLIKTFCLEKQMSYSNQKSEAIYKYIYENAKYPFRKKTRFLVLSTLIDNEITTLLEDIYVNLELLKLDKFTLLFYEEEGSFNTKEIFNTISDDFSKQIFVHEGFVLNESIKGEFIAHYLGCLLNSNCLNKDYSNIADLVLSADTNMVGPLLTELKMVYFDVILNKNNNRNILEVFFKNDLNVSQTAKELYLNRNSLINKLDIISKELGYDVQTFKIACVVLLIMNIK